MTRTMLVACISLFLLALPLMVSAEDKKMRTGYDAMEMSDVTLVHDVQEFNNGKRWRTNEWYQVPLDTIVCVQTKGKTVYARAKLEGWISFNNVITYRGSLYSAARYVKALGGTFWENADHYFNFPVRSGEAFMVRKPWGTPKPDWLEVSIQVIPFPSTQNP